MLNLRRGMKSMYLPINGSVRAEATDINPYIVPNSLLDICISAIQYGTNKEMKNVCPNEEKKLKKNP